MVTAWASDRVALPQALALSIRQAAVAAHPAEACGLLLGEDSTCIIDVTLAPNVAGDPERQFEIDPAHLFYWQRAARARGLAITGCWHSHPNGTTAPSPLDMAGAGWPGLLWLIVGGGAMQLWRAGDGAFCPLHLVSHPPGG